ncbi:MAG: vitamin K epoxide reductase family protein [Fimbriimonadales bacterium]|nr:vitamin K epoxide reductase family protein [Fimbriimonadales bacterium]
MNAIILNRLIILFASVGMVISALLWISHSADFALPCTGGGCDEVARSPYSRIVGIPVAALGFGYFGVLLVLALSRLQYPEQWRGYGKALAALSTLGLLAFAYFTYIQLFVLNLYEKGTPCWWCLGAAGMNLLVWLLSLMGLRGVPSASGMLTRELLQSTAVSLALIVAGLAYGGWQWNQTTKAETEQADNEKLKLLYLDGQGWRKGNENAPLIIVEFSDFQCPACKQAYEMLEKQILPQLGDKALFVFRHYPLINIHPMAWAAAAAAEEAGKQGKFWEMYAALFESQQELTPTRIEKIAEQLGLDSKKVRYAVDNEKVVHFKTIFRDFEEGSKLGVSSTPTFIVVYDGEIHTARGMGALMTTLNANPKIQQYIGKQINASPQ